MVFAERVIKFKVSDIRYVLPVLSVKEIVKISDITRIPNSPDYVEGVMEFRDSAATVVNNSVLLNSEEKTPNVGEDYLLIMNPELSSGDIIGITAQEVTSVDDFDNKLETNEITDDTEILSGFLKEEDEIYLGLDSETLLDIV